MKKLNKTQQQELNNHITELSEKKTDIEEAWAKFEEAHEALVNTIGEYNGVLASVIEWRDDLVSQMQDYQGERSERWQEGDAGQAYQSWIEEWEGLDLDTVEVPDLPDAPDFDHIDAIEQLPQEADSA